MEGGTEERKEEWKKERNHHKWLQQNQTTDNPDKEQQQKFSSRLLWCKKPPYCLESPFSGSKNIMEIIGSSYQEQSSANVYSSCSRHKIQDGISLFQLIQRCVCCLFIFFFKLILAFPYSYPTKGGLRDQEIKSYKNIAIPVGPFSLQWLCQ